jgi:hypothetical protein
MIPISTFVSSIEPGMRAYVSERIYVRRIVAGVASSGHWVQYNVRRLHVVHLASLRVRIRGAESCSVGIVRIKAYVPSKPSLSVRMAV